MWPSSKGKGEACKKETLEGNAVSPTRLPSRLICPDPSPFSTASALRSPRLKKTRHVRTRESVLPSYLGHVSADSYRTPERELPGPRARGGGGSGGAGRGRRERRGGAAGARRYPPLYRAGGGAGHAVTQRAPAGASRSGGFTLRVPRPRRAPREALPRCWGRRGNVGFPQRIATGIVPPWCRSLSPRSWENWDLLIRLLPKKVRVPCWKLAPLPPGTRRP